MSAKKILWSKFHVLFFYFFNVKLTSTYDKTATVAAQISAISSSVVFRAGTVTSLPPTLFVRAPNWFWKLCEGFFYFFFTATENALCREVTMVAHVIFHRRNLGDPAAAQGWQLPVSLPKENHKVAKQLLQILMSDHTGDRKSVV